MRFSYVLERDINAGGERTRRRRLAGHFLQGPDNGEVRVADLDRVAHARLELKKQAFLDEGSRFFAELPCGRRRQSLHRSVKRKTRAERPDTRQPGAAAFWKGSHRRKPDFARLGFA